jgi:hypothetical protein
VRRLLVLLLVALAVLPGTGGVARAAEAGGSLATEGGWRADFDRVCGQTDNAINMTAAELKAALATCDALRPAIEGLEPTPRKIYLKRLQMCRNLFAYMLETRLQGERK